MTTTYRRLNQPAQMSAGKTILWSGIIAGLLDAAAIVYLIFKGLSPVQVLQYIASSIFGNSAFTGGLLMVFAGLIVHLFIAFAFAGAFYFAYLKFFVLNMDIWITGLLYGLFSGLFMNFLVLPNLNTPKSPKDVVSVIEIDWHMALVGLPISLVTKKYYLNKQSINN